ncbi:pantothenate kinase [Litorimonas taeanensis]|uniref:Type III pantothenate kinase n=1 Tax=Litorimonas taeanensis TaxID=568099 RepID=A0A420WL60_9PROT|nr:type III pantothenate kinase [Litorimonas taeanensis]RKQ71646.1 pantothenate kinase [Litorimonas taeanensis]
MLLVIDTGNTNTLFAIHDGDNWAVEWRIATDPTRTADEYAVWFHQLLQMQNLSFDSISDCVISTVVPQSLFNMRNLVRRHLKVDPIIVGESDVKLGIGVRIDNPEQVGADRLVTTLGAVTRYDGPLIIIDSGTATTFDVVSADRCFEGGIIAPGINLSVKALHEAAAQLPRIEIRKPERIVGKNTVEAMQAGIFWGYIGLIDGLVEKIKEEDGRDFTVIGTGGVASLFEGASATIQHYDSQLTIDGLYEIWRLNK